MEKGVRIVFRVIGFYVISSMAALMSATPHSYGVINFVIAGGLIGIGAAGGWE